MLSWNVRRCTVTNGLGSGLATRLIKFFAASRRYAAGCSAVRNDVRGTPNCSVVPLAHGKTPLQCANKCTQCAS